MKEARQQDRLATQALLDVQSYKYAVVFGSLNVQKFVCTVATR